MFTLDLAKLKQEIASTQEFKGDLHRQKAAEFFHVPYEKATPKQREIGKHLNYFEMYSHRRELPK